MNVLFVADTPLASPQSGSERVLFEQAAGLSQKGWAVQALTRQNKEARRQAGREDARFPEIRVGMNTSSVPRFIRAGLQSIPRAFDAVTENAPPDAVVCHHPFNTFFLLIRGRLRRLPVVHVFHSPAHEEYLLANERRGRLRNWAPAVFRRGIQWICHSRADKTMVLSRYMGGKIESLYGVSESRLVVNPGGVDLVDFRPPADRTTLKRELMLPPGRLHLLTIRNLEPRMGLDNLLAAMAVLKAERLPVHLVLGGDGPERQRLSALVAKLGLQGSVTMTGFVPAERLADHYGAADFFVLPTRRLEGFGLVTPEALACGTPVLGTPVGGTCEILSRFESRFLFSGTSPEAIAAGIKAAAAQFPVPSGHYGDLRRRCRRFAAQNYSWERHVEILDSVLREACLHEAGGCLSRRNGWLKNGNETAWQTRRAGLRAPIPRSRMRQGADS
jgi:glycosyltransferase involved in cell wall biosynthesis